MLRWEGFVRSGRFVRCLSHGRRGAVDAETVHAVRVVITGIGERETMMASH